MIRDALGIAAIVALLFGSVYAMPRVDLWARDCGAGIMIQGQGGYWMQWKEECEK